MDPSLPAPSLPAALWRAVRVKGPWIAAGAFAALVCLAAWILVPNRPWPLVFVRATGVVLCGVCLLVTGLLVAALGCDVMDRVYRARAAARSRGALERRALFGDCWRVTVEGGAVRFVTARGPLAPERACGYAALLAALAVAVHTVTSAGLPTDLSAVGERFEAHLTSGVLVGGGLLLVLLGSLRLELLLESRGPLRVLRRTTLTRSRRELPRETRLELTCSWSEGGPLWRLGPADAVRSSWVVAAGAQDAPPPELAELLEVLSRELERLRAPCEGPA